MPRKNRKKPDLDDTGGSSSSASAAPSASPSTDAGSTPPPIVPPTLPSAITDPDDDNNNKDTDPSIELTPPAPTADPVVEDFDDEDEDEEWRPQKRPSGLRNVVLAGCAAIALAVAACAGVLTVKGWNGEGTPDDEVAQVDPDPESKTDPETEPETTGSADDNEASTTEPTQKVVRRSVAIDDGWNKSIQKELDSNNACGMYTATCANGRFVGPDFFHTGSNCPKGKIDWNETGEPVQVSNYGNMIHPWKVCDEYEGASKQQFTVYLEKK